MNTLHDSVGFEEQVTVWDAKVQHGAVVARANENILVSGQLFGQSLDELEFVHELKWHSMPDCAREAMPPIDRVAVGDINDKVNAVEARVSSDRREQRVGHFQQENENESQQNEWDERNEVRMNGSEDDGRAV